MSNETMPPLNEQEAAVILHKATEAPFSGEYENLHDPGVYICRQCGQALYESKDKFDSSCGWPSFDMEVPGSVLRKPDKDGRRTEILCSACGGHLGHVFEGEGFTPRNVRHCVNSLSMKFVPAQNIHSALFAGGCFWGVEDAFSKIPGVIDVTSGYTGGHVKNPTYQQVCSGETGHAEAVLVRYDASRVDYESLARLFFEIHDPTQVNRQGPDVGLQYRSEIFYTDPEQKEIAEKLIQILSAQGLDVATLVTPASPFYPAEDYHQDYARRTGRGACHLRVKRF